VPVPAVGLLLHGYGSDEHDLAGLAEALGLVVPWASLRAPLDMGNGGAAWFAITTPGDPAAEPVIAATDAIWGWIDANLHPATRVVPIGFSQGGLMASQLLRTRPDRALAPVVMGGFVLGAPQPADERLQADRPPAFWGRGDQDRVITAAAIERTGDYLPRHTSLTRRVYPGLGHGIGNAEIADVRGFLAAHVGADAVSGR
jgi:phospholipase/carboxylesterase